MEGEPEAGAWSCGMVAGLVSDIPSVKELIDRIMSEAEEIIASKLSKAIQRSKFGTIFPKGTQVSQLGDLCSAFVMDGIWYLFLF